MATLAVDKVRQFRNLGSAVQYPIVATDILYRGSAISRNSSGDARPLSTSDSVFLGFNDANADNNTGSAGDKLVEVYVEGEVLLSVTSVNDDDDVSSTVYASDDDTFTLASTGNLAVGKVMQWVTGTTCWVKFQGHACRSI